MTLAVNNINLNLRLAINAALILTIGMGFGRFAFTIVYPRMVEEGLLSLQTASFTASANYAGYLLGALLAIKIRGYNSELLCLWSTLGTVCCLAILVIFDSTPIIIFVRGIAGIFSALTMVSASVWLLEYCKQVQYAPLLYAGVGLGIALSAELIVLGEFFGLSSKGLWLLLAIFSLVIGLLAIQNLKSNMQTKTLLSNNLFFVNPENTKPVNLVIIYGLAGFGYIITATYLPLLVHNTFYNINSAHIWALFGICAIPSCFIWHKLHEKLGSRITLLTNLSLQAFGVIFPIIFPSTIGYLLSAVLVGGTFMGTVTIVMQIAQHITNPKKLIAIMTIAYGIGQIIGPIITNALFSITLTFNSSLIAAFVALLGAALISIKTL